jgi:hypothetical protein
VSRPGEGDEPPDPEIETIRNHWDTARDLGYRWITIAAALLLPVVLTTLITGLTHESLVVRVVAIAAVVLVLVGNIAFYLGRKVGYRYGIAAKIDDEIRRNRWPEDGERDETHSRQDDET